MQTTVFLGELRFFKLRIDEAEVVMGRHIFGVERECLLELGNSIAEKVFAFGFIALAALEFGPFEKRLAKLVDDFIVLAEIEAALIQLGIAILEDAAKFR